MEVRNPFLPCFLLLIVSFVMLLLCSISTPVVHSLYFLQSDITGGSRYGMWGWCDYGLSYCFGNYLYWGFDPFFIVWITKVLVFYPIATIITFLTLIALLPASIRSEEYEPRPNAVFPLLAILAFITSLLAFVFGMALFGVARSRFHADGIGASFGPCMWMSLVAMILLLFVALLSLFGHRRRPSFY